MELTNDNFCNLMSIKKRFVSDSIMLPTRGQTLQLDVLSIDEKESFIVDVDRSGRIEIKSKVQKRYSNNYLLIRIEINAPPHTNPDSTTTSRDHIHIYREGYGLSWAYDLKDFDKVLFNNLKNFNQVFIDFCFYCNIELDDDFQMVI